MIERTDLFRHGGLDVTVLRDLGPERDRCETELSAAGLSLPLPHRSAWARFRQPARSWFLAARDAAGVCRGGFAIEVNPSRALPGHLLLRVHRLGDALPREIRNAALAALAAFAARNRRVLRVNVEVFSRDGAPRNALTGSLAGLGFRQVTSPRSYTHTLAVDLTPDEEAHFAALRPKVRRDIRAVAKNPVAVRPVTDPAFVERLNDLAKETMGRTGGRYQSENWPAIIELSRLHPAASRLVGLFRTDASGPESLLAYAWGCGHGDHAHYDSAGSTRATDLKVPLGYAPMWDLICWARRNGARWFDLGGVTPGSYGDGEDRLGGISDFKRFFSTDVVTVGEEWVFEPHWLRAKLARAVSTGAGWLSGARGLWLG